MQECLLRRDDDVFAGHLGGGPAHARRRFLRLMALRQRPVLPQCASLREGVRQGVPLTRSRDEYVPR